MAKMQSWTSNGLKTFRYGTEGGTLDFSERKYDEHHSKR